MKEFLSTVCSQDFSFKLSKVLPELRMYNPWCKGGNGRIMNMCSGQERMEYF